jgi:hypothetical protein
MSGENAAEWKEAMDKELKNLHEKQTWQQVLMPVNSKKIGAKWVLKFKRDAEGNIGKYKARLVAKGYSQIPGVDFEETYAPVGLTTSLRILLTITVPKISRFSKPTSTVRNSTATSMSTSTWNILKASRQGTAAMDSYSRSYY